MELGPLTLRIFQLPNGTYCLCLADVLAVETSNSAIQNAVSSKVFKSSVLPESIRIEGLEKTFSPVSFEAAILYWQRRAMEENSDAHRVMRALTKTSLRQLAEETFGT